ncbi:MAG: 3-oxoacid CoA-transferase subunit A, partial [Xanthobacteraceae bacterium]
MNKIVQSMAEAMAGIRDGAVVLLGGFGNIGQPHALLDGLIEQGAKNLTVVSNNAGVGRAGLARLLDLGRVRKIICSYPRTADPVVFEELYRAGKIELEIVPQGTMAERMRAAGAGIPAFYTPTSVGTLLAKGKEVREFSGRDYVLEEAFHGDVALIDGLIEHGAKDLTVVSNNAGVGRIGLARLLELGRVRKIICSYPRTVDPVVFEELYRAG